MINPVKGTHDITYDDATAFANIELRAKLIASLYNYNEIMIPIIEHSELYQRGVGESSDIVRKEMYQFQDKGGRDLSLRPEFTAGVMRSVVSNKLYANHELPLKFFYSGPCFRYERPQAGRYRQFYQFGIEAIGEPSSYLDSEAIIIGYRIIQSLGVGKVKIKINTLGDPASRARYKEALVAYFKDHIDEMCSDCKARLESNPLRILDCKVPHDIEVVKNAPKMADYLSDEAKIYYKQVLLILKDQDIDYEEDDTLVRGLDYYSGVVWEYSIQDNDIDLGALGGGGHYDKLLKEVGGPDYEGVGFSLGMERLIETLKSKVSGDMKADGPDFYVCALDDDSLDRMFNVSQEIRDSGMVVNMPYKKRSISQALKAASKANAKFALICGESELKEDHVIVKNLKTGEQKTIEMTSLIEEVVQLLQEYFRDNKESILNNKDDEEDE